MAEIDLTAERVRELLHYNPLTGAMTWRLARCNVAAGAPAGSRRGNGSGFDVRVDGRLYRLHRLAWLYMTGAWPAGVVSFVDLNPLNSCWKNLADVTRSQSHQAQKLRSDCRHGLRGVEIHSSGLWRASLTVNGRRFRLGYFHSPEAAVAARLAAETKHFTHRRHSGPQA